MNLTSGISRTAASTTSLPSYWTNAFRVGDQPRSMIRRQIASRAFRQRSRSAGRPRRVASRIARSIATQHMSCEYRNFLGPPRVSQMPSSG
jgi:hypothetical protein